MITTTHPPLHLLQKVQPAATSSHRRQAKSMREAPMPAGWLQRLACWAERQPSQHRLGSLDAYRHF